MKRRRTKKKAPLSLWGKTKLKLNHLKEWSLEKWDSLWFNLGDEELQGGLLLVLFAAVLHFGCLDFESAVKWLALLWGSKKVWEVVKH
tara:strand:- start:253 stop:516 length:264 start_codon:yes stop_codon:yes gene_type:complete